MLTLLIVCIAYFVYLFLLAMQSLVLNHSHNNWALPISITATVLQFHVIKKVVVSGDWLIIALAVSGGLGIHTASVIFRWWKKRNYERKNKNI